MLLYGLCLFPPKTLKKIGQLFESRSIQASGPVGCVERKITVILIVRLILQGLSQGVDQERFDVICVEKFCRDLLKKSLPFVFPDNGPTPSGIPEARS